MTACPCLNNGQCVLNNYTLNYFCVCSDCTGGEYCEDVYSYVQYLISSSISVEILLHESPSTRMALKILFIFLFSLLTGLSFVNNLLTLLTCFIRKIRITVCGIYMILYCIISLLCIIFIEILAFVVLFYNNDLKEHPLIYCTFISIFLNFAHAMCQWICALIAVERVLIQYCVVSLYRRRIYAVICLVILFLFIGSGSALSAAGRSVGKNPVLSTSYVCSFDRYSNKHFKTAHQVIGSMYAQFVIPWFLSLVSVVLTLIHLIRHKIAFTDLERNSWFSLIMQQISKHKDFFVSPLINIIFSFPENLVVNIVGEYCVAKSVQRLYLRLHIAFDFLLFMPLILTFFIYIYPSKVYMSLFRELQIVKWIKLKIRCCCCPTASNMVKEISEEQIVE